ncbi:MAG: hypothetical protein KC729_07075 [Candidatus Eisenbacteria bacterium]|uniref:Uncharacterized protein n=1 Tax=Eiseniibacteriota bacterium TaxID=2212470 RepID=A0A956LYP0_UNCEI|nr:hypothetical protein [Candidatus Eisenbacteria bacterium]
MHRNLRSVRAAAAVFLVFGSISCVFPTKDDKGPVANDPPTVRIIEGAANEGASGVDYRVRFRWTGFDADGMVSAFRWAVDTDDENADTWTTTTDSSIFLTFQTTTPDPDGTHYTDWHSFSIQAIDNEGARSTVVTQMFNARTIAPTSRITFPSVMGSGFLTLWSSAKMEWTGEDLDATDPDLTPTAFEYKLARTRPAPAPASGSTTRAATPCPTAYS